MQESFVAFATLAQQRLATLSARFDRNSRWGRTPNGGTLIVGRYASVVPCSFDAPPFTAFDIQSMMFFGNAAACDGIALRHYRDLRVIYHVGLIVTDQLIS